MNSRCIFYSTTIAILMTTAMECSAGQTRYVLTGTVTHPHPGRRNEFNDIKITDDYLLVSAPSWSIPGDPGQVFLYDVTGQHLLHTFDDPTPATLGFGGAFGDVEIGGNHVVITDYNGASLGGGLVRIYDAESGHLRHTLSTPIPDHASFAGGAVAVDGDYVVVGAYGISLGGGQDFPARIFVFDATSGELRHTLSPPDRIVPWDWGDVIEISGSTIAVGTPSDPNTAVLLYDAQTGEQFGSVEHSQSDGFDFLRIRGNKILFGQNLSDTFLFDTAGDLLQTIQYPSHLLNGSSSILDFSGNNILIGSSGHYDPNAMITPALWLYDGTSGELIQHFSDAAAGDRYFGMVSNPSGSHIAIRNSDNEVLIYSRIPEPSSAVLLLSIIGLLGTLRRVLYV